jgi:hypothetical protein
MYAQPGTAGTQVTMEAEELKSDPLLGGRR